MKILYYLTMLVLLLVSACGREAVEESMTDVGGRWACEIEKQYECTLNGCVSRDRPLAISIDFDKGEYNRCMGPTCDAYPVQLHEDLLLPVLIGKMDRARGAYFVVDDDGTNFVESLSQGAWTRSSFGNCKSETVTG